MDFLNDLGKKFTQAVRSVTGKGGDEAESPRVTLELNEAEAKLEALFTRLGRACYAAELGKAAPPGEELFHAVSRQLETVETLRDRRNRLSAQVRCPACGAGQSPDARYCSACGRRMPEETPLETDTPEADGEALEYCNECGALRERGEPFCGVCGHPFDAPSEPDRPAAPIAPTAPLPETLEEPAEDYAER